MEGWRERAEGWREKVEGWRERVEGEGGGRGWREREGWRERVEGEGGGVEGEGGGVEGVIGCRTLVTWGMAGAQQNWECPTVGALALECLASQEAQAQKGLCFLCYENKAVWLVVHGTNGAMWRGSVGCHARQRHKSQLLMRMLPNVT